MSTSSTRLSTPLGSTSRNTPKPSSSTSTPHNKSQPQQHQQQHTHNAAYNLLTKAHPNDPETADKIFTDKIAHKPLLLSTTPNDTNSRSARRHLRHRRKAYALQHARPKPLSAKEKRALKLYDLKPRECRYEIYRGLNRLWRRYILEVLGYVDREGRVVPGRIGQPVTANTAGAAIAGADFHGMEVEVVACRDLGRVGCKGIVVRETRSALVVVCDEREGSGRKLKGRRGKSRAEVEGEGKVMVDFLDLNPGKDGAVRDKVRMILKRGAVFRVTVDLPTKAESDAEAGMLGLQTHQSDQRQSNIEIDDGPQTAITMTTTKTMDPVPKSRLVFELHGDQLEIRPIERAVKKFKWKPTDYL